MALAFFNYLTGSILYLTEKQDFHSHTLLSFLLHTSKLITEYTHKMISP